MGTQLKQILRSLCIDEDWHYAVFWKLKHRSRMVLTWEDAYYKNHLQYNPPENKIVSKLSNEHYPHESLGLAVAKMSYHVYSLGEGIVGQVAVSGKHQWIFADRYMNNSSSSSFEYDDGWKTQFSAGIKTVIVVAVVPHGVIQLGSLNKVNEDLRLVNYIREVFLSHEDSSPGHSLSFTDSQPGSHQSKTVEIGNNHGVLESSISEVDTIYKSLQSISENCNLERNKQLQTKLLDGKERLAESSAWKNSNVGSKHFTPFLENDDAEDMSLSTSFKFSAGCELLEVLGPAFSKQLLNDWEMNDIAEVGPTSTTPLTSGYGSENLLEAVVANVSRNCSDSNTKSEKSSCKSMQSTMTVEETKHTLLSANHSIDRAPFGEENMQHCLSSSGGGFSSACPSICSEQGERFSEPANNTTSRKRAKPGESCKPRPRDRQLIQDRIKELRDLVPSGSKCSIDSLLERTIKHMLYLQSVTKHADKLKKCADSKLCNKEQGSSWAVEVGSHLKVCTIIVENLNMDGQMLVEMLCEECSHFLEIAEAIRSLGLIILKGVTESHGEKTWICFIVEGETNRSMHRMDILWSLVQILQPKTTGGSSHASSTFRDNSSQTPS